VVLVPFSTKLLLLIILPSLVIALFGVFAFRAVTPLAYRCRRCGGAFTRPSHRGFPTQCALCRSKAWNER
jgi:hypothetical protein